MSGRWHDRNEVNAIHARHTRETLKLNGYILELAAALVRMDRNGYQQRLLDRVYLNTGLTAEKVTAFNDERNDRIAARKTTGPSA